MHHSLKPQDKFKAKACFPLHPLIFGLLWSALKPEDRFVDKELWDADVPHFILMDGTARRACFYAKRQRKVWTVEQGIKQALQTIRKNNKLIVRGPTSSSTP